MQFSVVPQSARVAGSASHKTRQRCFACNCFLMQMQRYARSAEDWGRPGDSFCPMWVSYLLLPASEATGHPGSGWEGRPFRAPTH